MDYMLVQLILNKPDITFPSEESTAGYCSVFARSGCNNLMIMLQSVTSRKSGCRLYANENE